MVETIEQKIRNIPINMLMLTRKYPRIWMGLCVGAGLAAFYCAKQLDNDKVTEASAPVQEQSSPATATSPKLTPLQQWQEYERAQRDLLYDRLMTQAGEESLLAVLANMPTKLSFLDKWHPSRRLNVGPRQYLFESRPTLHQTANVPLSARPDSCSLWLSVWGSETPWYTYHDAIDDSAYELGVRSEPYIEQMTNIPLAPFYESIRNPTAQDLERLYRFADAHIPQFIVDAFYKIAVKEEIAHARQMIAADPMIYDAPSLQHPEGYQYWSPVADPARAQFIVQPTRYENGELELQETTGSGEHIVRTGSLVLPEQWEKQSPFTKWLYRRGPLFIDNFEIMLDAYRTSDSADEFADKVMQNLSLKK